MQNLHSTSPSVRSIEKITLPTKKRHLEQEERPQFKDVDSFRSLANKQRVSSKVIEDFINGQIPPNQKDQNLLASYVLQQEEFEAFLWMTKPGSGVTSLSLGPFYCPRGEKPWASLPTLAQVLKTSTIVTSLSLENLNPKGQAVLTNALKENNSLTSLAIDFSHIDTQGAAELAEVLKKHDCALVSLSLHQSEIDAAGVTALAGAIEKNQTLTELDLGTNKFGDQGAIALVGAIEKNQTLTSLKLSINKIGDPGAIALAGAIEKNEAITSLNLSHNEIGHEGAIKLADALEKNKKLTSLNLGANNIDGEGATALVKVFKANSSPTSLNLSDNKIGTKGAIPLADELKKNSSLTSLDLGFNKIGHEGYRRTDPSAHRKHHSDFAQRSDFA
jgi:hypothetical protein